MTPRQRHLKRWQALRNERSVAWSHWRELAEYIEPRRGRFLETNPNQQSKRTDKLINSTPRLAKRILQSGLFASVSSPARPWFRFTTPDPTLSEAPAVRSWLYEVEEIHRTVFARSNLYNALHSLYGDLITFGTAAMFVEEDEDDFVRAYVLPIGQYALAASARGRIDTCYRELFMSVAQMVERFGEDKCSQQVKSKYREGDLDAWIRVLHVVEPNKGDGPFAYHSCWMEYAAPDDAAYLHEGGFDEFPVLAPRWEVNGEETYGTSPGMDALGDCRALQLLERRKAQVYDKIVDPPMIVPASMAGADIKLLPGATIPEEPMAQGQTVRPAVVVDPRAAQMAMEAIREHEDRIRDAFYARLWMLFGQRAGTQKTATEVEALHEEKLLQLGPVVERLQDELFDPLFDRLFGILLRNGHLPPPPEEIQGQALKIEYLSMISQAQKILGTGTKDRLMGMVLTLSQAVPDALDKLNADELIDTYAEDLGVPPQVVRDDGTVAALREQRAASQQEAQQAASMREQAAAVRDLGNTPAGGDTALNALLAGMGAPPVQGGGAL